MRAEPLERIERRAYANAQHFVRHLIKQSRPVNAGEVIHLIKAATETLVALLSREIYLDQVDVRKRQQLFKILIAPAAKEILGNRYVMSTAGKPSRQMISNEPRSAGDKYFFIP